MSENINKVLADRAQSFTTAEQKQARDNIGAQASITYSYSGSSITGIDGSALAGTGSLSTVARDANLSGNGTSGSPLGLNSAINLECSGDFYGSSLVALGWTPGAQGYGTSNGLLVSAYSGNKAVKITYAGMYVNHPASGIGGDAQTSYYGASPDLWYNGSSQYLKHTWFDESGMRMEDKGLSNNSAVYGASAAQFWDHDLGQQVCDASSIYRWNNMTGGGRARNSATLVWDHDTDSTHVYHVTGVMNNAINYVLVSGHTADVCNILIEAPVIGSAEDYDYAVQFDCVDSEGNASVDVENAYPEIKQQYSLGQSIAYLKTELTTATAACEPDAAIVKDYEGNNKHLWLVPASYPGGVTEFTTTAMPGVLSGVTLNTTKYTDHTVDFGSASPTYQVRVLGEGWNMRKF